MYTVSEIHTKVLGKLITVMLDKPINERILLFIDISYPDRSFEKKLG
jgi:hypothetical protein